MAIKMTEKDFEVSNKALIAHHENKKVELKCPHCNTPIHIDDFGNAWVVRCETSECFKETIKGF